jgi:hypothetical protein
MVTSNTSVDISTSPRLPSPLPHSSNLPRAVIDGEHVGPVMDPIIESRAIKFYRSSRVTPTPPPGDRITAPAPTGGHGHNHGGNGHDHGSNGHSGQGDAGPKMKTDAVRARYPPPPAWMAWCRIQVSWSQ